ncbi:MAG: Type pilus assembly PilZ [Betaproteobacteria bacterium]|nr:Type pilus assembly PilZ [Betaproteobacteria bacterium]
MADDTTKTAQAGGARPSMLSLNIKEKSALYAAFMPHLTNGGLFIPTTRGYKLGDQVYMLLSLMDDPAKLPVAGTVVWVTPAGAHGSKQQGVGVQFSSDESGQSARRKIENILGNAIASTRPTHTL